MYFLIPQVNLEEPFSKDANISTDAFFLIVGKTLVYAMAPLMSLPYLIESCIIPHIEKLLAKDKDVPVSTKSGKGKATPFVGNRAKAVRWFDLLWAFLEVCLKLKQDYSDFLFNPIYKHLRF